MGKRKKRICMYIILAVLLFPVNTVWAAGTEGSYSVGVTVQYGQAEARSMLDRINDFRTGEDAWAWNENDTEKVSYSGLDRLKYDYGLEEIAMQRAAEIAVYFAHERPNGGSALDMYGGARGENIAAGQSTAESVFVSWKEEKESYSGQGHRRNMLDAGFAFIGIGHVYFNGTHYWVQEFSSQAISQTETSPSVSEKTVQIDVLTDKISAQSPSDVGQYKISYGVAAELPKLSPKMRLTGTWPAKMFPINGEFSWVVEDASFAKIEDGKITGEKVGSTGLAVSGIDGMKIPLTIDPCPIQDAQVQLSVSTCKYDKKEQTPGVQSVILNNKTLAADDYSVSYKDNVEPGTAKAIITGKGNYQGTIEKEFTIICEHQFDDGRVTRGATCTEDGEKIYTCGLCGATETEKIQAAGHTEETDQAVAPTCTEDGKTQGSHCSVCREILIAQETIPATGHKYENGPSFDWSGNTACKCMFICMTCGAGQSVDCDITSSVEPATCIANGRITYTATAKVEGETYTDTKMVDTEKTGHTEVTDQAVAPTCTESGKTKGSHCSVCKEILIAQETVPATGHTYRSVCTKATVKADGKITEECSRCKKIKSETPIYRPATMKLSSKKYVYDGKEKKPSVTVTDRNGKRVGAGNYKVNFAKGCKNVGKYKVTVTFQGNYTGQMSQTFTIQPKSVTLAKVQNVKGKKMKVQWKRNTAASGYQIQYATKASFKGAKNVSVKNSKKAEQTIGKLVKGKRYYVRIRTYKTVSGEKIYSDWSGKKSVVIKK